MKLPVRIDLIGGWSDQPLWKHRAAVVNAAVGWDGQYPITIKDGKVTSLVEGIGTGLGISSIIQAGLILDKNRNADYVADVLDWEEKQGTRGGWQDQIGGIEPGLKLLTSNDHKKIEIHSIEHPITDYLVLFDTGLRRPAKTIGDKVRELFGTRKFDSVLKRNVADASRVTEMTGEEFAQVCIEGWERLNRLVDMDMPCPNLGMGHKLCGAGGGGYGVYFVEPLDREEVIMGLTQLGIWAKIPNILKGVLYE